MYLNFCIYLPCKKLGNCSEEHAHTHTHTVTGPDCAVMYNFMNTHTHKMWETGETWVEKEKTYLVDKKGLVE